MASLLLQWRTAVGSDRPVSSPSQGDRTLASLSHCGVVVRSQSASFDRRLDLHVNPSFLPLKALYWTRRAHRSRPSRPFLDTHAQDAAPTGEDRKSTRLNSSHSQISYAVFCL